MLLYEIIKRRVKGNPNPVVQGKAISEIFSREEKLDCLNRYLKRFKFKENDKVSFKRPKKQPKIVGTIAKIETDVDKIIWSKEGLQPYFVAVLVDWKEGGTNRANTIWVNPNRLVKE